MVNSGAGLLERNQVLVRWSGNLIYIQTSFFPRCDNNLIIITSKNDAGDNDFPEASIFVTVLLVSLTFMFYKKVYDPIDETWCVQICRRHQ